MDKATQDKISHLPEDIKGLLRNEDLPLVITALSQEQGISNVVSLAIEDAVADLLTGDLPPGKFSDVLVKEGVPSEKAYSVSQIIATEVISEAGESIKHMYHLSGPLKEAFTRPAPHPQTTPATPPPKPFNAPIPPKPTIPPAPTLKIPLPPQPSKPAAPQTTPASTVAGTRPPIQINMSGNMPSPTTGGAKTFARDLERAKSGLPPAPMMTVPVGMEKMALEKPVQKPIAPQTTPPSPQVPQNLPGALRPSIASSGKMRPSDNEPAAHTISIPKNAFEEKLQRTVGGTEREGTSVRPVASDPYREPLQ
jgi:hypothetical protein